MSTYRRCKNCAYFEGETVGLCLFDIEDLSVDRYIDDCGCESCDHWTPMD